MNEYRTIKDLVIGTCASEEAFSFPSYERLTSLVRKHFPTSKWKETHYAWYKSQIKRGGISVPGWDGPPGDPGAELGVSEEEVEDAVEASLSLERDLHTYLARKVDALEPGLTLVEGGVEYQTDAGRIDLLAKDPTDNLVVIELKAGKAKDAALGQLLGYIGCVSIGRSVVRGILVASSFEPRVIFAAKALANVKLIKYQVAFELHEIT